MEQKIAFVKTGWSEEYKGGLVVGKGIVISKKKRDWT